MATGELKWATVGGSQIIEPPDAKKIQGNNAGQPTAAEYMNWLLQRMIEDNRPNALPDAAKTFGLKDMHRRHVINPSSVRVLTLPTTGVLQGSHIEIFNARSTGPNKITVEASGGQDIASFQNGKMVLAAKRDTPTASAHWDIMDGTGGAKPFWRAEMSGTQNIASTAATKIDLDTEVYDPNDDYDPTTNQRFTVSVPGFYRVFAFVTVSDLTAFDLTFMSITKNGSNARTAGSLSGNPTTGWTYQIEVTVAMDIGDYFEVVIDSESDSNYNVRVGTVVEGHLLAFRAL